MQGSSCTSKKEPSRAVERPCRDCVWHSEDGCFIWDCEPITRQQLADAVRRVKEIDRKAGEEGMRLFAQECLIQRQLDPRGSPLYKKLMGEVDS